MKITFPFVLPPPSPGSIQGYTYVKYVIAFEKHPQTFYCKAKPINAVSAFGVPASDWRLAATDEWDVSAVDNQTLAVWNYSQQSKDFSIISSPSLQLVAVYRIICGE